jgi:lambda family phage portal protein
MTGRFLSRVLSFFRSKRAVFHGAQGTRLMLDWVASILSADQEIKANARLLRARSRDLVRNNPTAKHFLNLVAANVVGPHGVTYQARVRNNDGKLNLPLNEKIEEAWEDWCLQDNCAVDGKLSLRALCDLVIRTVPQDGEAFVRMVRGYENPHGFALQLFDADQIDPLYNRAPEHGQNEIRLGIEVNKWGRPVAYWVTKGHPSDQLGSFERERVPASDVVHLYDPLRVNQTRGVTWFHSVMVPLRMLDGYIEAELIAARAGAAKMGFLRYTDASAYDAPDPEKGVKMDVRPGVIDTLPPGLEFVEWNPEHPAQAFPMFVQAMLRLVATGLGVSYNSLANDLIGVNYSSMRSGLLLERDQWRRLQSWFMESFLQRVFDAWMPMALLTGKLVLDSRDPAKFREGRWQPRGWQWVDPLKDVQASILAIAAGLSSRDEVISDKGGDFGEVAEQIAEEQKIAESYGLDFSAVGKPMPPKLPSEGDTVDTKPKAAGDTADEESEQVFDFPLPALTGARTNGRAH